MSKPVQVLVGCAAFLVCLYVLDKDPVLAERLGNLWVLAISIGLPLLLLILVGAWLWDMVSTPSKERRIREITEESARGGHVWDEALEEWVYDEERARAILDALPKPKSLPTRLLRMIMGYSQSLPK
jgi:hypothetical protein